MNLERLQTLLLGALVAAVFVVFWPSLKTPFFFDDVGDIVHNQDIRQLWPPSWLFAGPPNSNALAGRPVSALSFALSYAWGGLQVTGYHLFNIALHAASALLLFGLVKRILALPKAGPVGNPERLWLSGAIAGFWALHPLLTEPVAYTIQRTELLVSFFYLATLYAAVRAIAENRRVLWETVAILAAVLGMGSKETMVSAPFMVLLLDWIFLGPGALRQRRRLYLGLAASWLVLGVLLASGRQTSVALHSEEGISSLQYLWTQGRVITRYLRIVLWPHPLAIAYDWPARTPVDVGLLPFVLVGAFLAGSAWAACRRHWPGFVGLGFFLILAPSSSIVPLPSEVVAERRMYLPLACCVSVIVFGAREALRRWVPVAARAAAALGISAVILMALSVGSWQRLQAYRSEFTIWEDAARNSPAHSTVRNNYARELILQKRFREAIPHLKEAIRLRPDIAPPHYLLGFALLAEGDARAAAVSLKESVRIDPKTAGAHFSLGRALAALGDHRGAATAFREAARLGSMDKEAQTELSASLAQAGDVPGAIAALQEAIRLAPDDPKLHNNLASLLVRAGRGFEGMAALKEAVRLNPSYALGHFNLGNALAAQGSFEEAVDHYLDAVRIRPDDSRIHVLVLARLRSLPLSARGALRKAQADPNPAVRALVAKALAR